MRGSAVQPLGWSLSGWQGPCVSPATAPGSGRMTHSRGADSLFANPGMCRLLQKRDIQLLKAYMRAIRSVNPNLQNLEETIEYNEILE